MTDVDALLFGYGCRCSPRTIVQRGFYVGCSLCGVCYRANPTGEVDVNPPIAGTGAACHYCKARPEVLTRDHIVPRAHGGPDRRTNIVMACTRCNQKKADARSSCVCRQCRLAWEHFAPDYDLPIWRIA